ncbi:MAG: glycoside hydrolase family 38 C-terminal domain-containing protein [Oscillospiraceae bacterium]|nr:glycoside hydrolase family 38 C-terminal domain-containing protein [Oscillospiraceae bacterium]
MKKLHVMSNSHLDREHRHNFQETRIMLVKMMDKIIEIMESDSNYRFFTLDGQAIVLDDYLEVKPQMRERLTRLIKDGRILIGPWYSLVDCYSVNPESIIRNLIKGDRCCKQYGEPMKLGYSIFSFGQMAQLPQVYAGFGINDIVFYKGASAKEFPQSEFIWRAPDGTKAFTTRLGKEKRWNFFFDFDIPVILGGDAKKPGWQSKFNEKVRLCHLNDEKFGNMYATELETDVRIREEKIENAINTVMDLLNESAAKEVFLAFEGTDFTSPLAEMPEAIRKANEIMNGKVNLVHSNPVAYFEEVKKDIDLSVLKEYEGEMRFGPINSVHAETMGTNSEIKQSMFKAETKLICYAEPLSTILMANGGEYEKDILNLAWKYLLETQAHDSVHGSGDPQIKKDNLNRLDQVNEIVESVIKRAVEGICSYIDLSKSADDEISVVVFNTLPYTRSEIMKLIIDLPAEELVEDYYLQDQDGNRIECYQLGKKKFNLAMIHPQNRPKSVYSDRFEIMANLIDIPAMGYKVLKVIRKKGDSATSTNPFPLGYFPYNPIAKMGNVLDNGLLRVTIQNNGTVDVYDYRTGHVTFGLNTIYDIGSSGDFWVHREPYYNSTLSTKGGSAKIELIMNSQLAATYKITSVMDIPKSLNYERDRRTSETIATAITTEITLKKDSNRIDFITTLNNQSGDHMMVASFPTGVNSEKALWESLFEIRERDVDSFTNDNGKKGPELERQAMQNFIYVSDDKETVSLFTKGLKEVGTTSDDFAIINLTLFRAATNTFPIHNDLLIGFEEETSQCYGNQKFEYAVQFDSNNVDEDQIIMSSRRYIAPLISAELGAGNGGFLPKTLSFMQKKNNSIVISAFKCAEDDNSVILRLYNPTNKQQDETLTFTKEFEVVYTTNMNEEIEGTLKENSSIIDLSVPAYKILTYKITF